MAFSLSKLSPDRLQGVHPDLVGMVERAIQITTQDFRVQESCACVSARPSWSRAAPAGPCTSGISPATPSIWRRRTERSAGRGRTTFRVAAAMQAAAHELETPEDGFADFVAACRARGRRPFLDGPHFELSRVCRHNRLDQNGAGSGGDRGRSLIAPQTSASTKNVAADELTWFAVEVVE